MIPKSFPSISEDHGIMSLDETDLKIYSAGISTAGLAEIRMANGHPERLIVATTIDSKGAEYSKKFVQSAQLSNQITVNIEDLRNPLPHEDIYFDFIYARLSLHYLSKSDLEKALKELYRILKHNGHFFIVVQSASTAIAQTPGATTDPETKITTIKAERGLHKRYFHTETSIQDHLKEAEFNIMSVKSYDELLCRDYERKKPSQSPTNVIEVFGNKL